MEVHGSSVAGAVPWIPLFGEERGPLPQVVVDDSEAVWREYDASCAALDSQLQQLRAALARVATTAPVQHARLRDIEARFSAELARGADVDEVMALARQGSRVCPKPGPWRALYLLLPIAREPADPRRAPLPVELREWQRTTDFQKQVRLREQLEWAQAHDGLQRVRDFLAALREADWHHSAPAEWPRI
jgi:hypothetical protein